MEKYWYDYEFDPTLGEIAIFAGDYAPSGWALCNGQILPIAQNDALFTLIGWVYGGDGRTTFALPDLRGRFPVGMGMGTGPGLSDRDQGQSGGAESMELPVAEVAVPSPVQGGPRAMAAPPDARIATVPPYLALNFIIALHGVYPSRS